MMTSSDSSAVAGGLARHIPVLGRPAVEFLKPHDGGIYIDATLNGETVTPVLGLDGTTSNLQTITGSTRSYYEIGVGRYGRVVDIRLDATLNDVISIWGVEFDLYIPG